MSSFRPPSMEIVIGIASTTHLDRHFERVSKECLEDNARQINERFIKSTLNHDPAQGIGVILAGKVLPMSDGEWALAIVGGLWEREEDLQYKWGEENTVYEQYLPLLDELPLPLVARGTNVEDTIKKPQNLADYLEIHLDSTAVWPDGRVLKTKRWIASAGDLQIHIYPHDHDPPHFHVISKQRGIDGRFSIHTLELINDKRGHISPNDVKKIKYFFELRPDMLTLLREEYERLKSS